MCACVCAELWGRGTTDHKRGHTVQSLQWCRKEEELGEGENGNKIKEKKKNRHNEKLRPSVLAQLPASAQRKETRVPARLLALKGKFCFVLSEQESKSLVTDLQKWRQKCKRGRLADSGVACWTILACRKKRVRGGRDKGEGWDLCPVVPASGSPHCIGEDGQQLHNNLTFVYSISKIT